MTVLEQKQVTVLLKLLPEPTWFILEYFLPYIH